MVFHRQYVRAVEHLKDFDFVNFPNEQFNKLNQNYPNIFDIAKITNELNFLYSSHNIQYNTTYNIHTYITLYMCLIKLIKSTLYTVCVKKATKNA